MLALQCWMLERLLAGLALLSSEQQSNQKGGPGMRRAVHAAMELQGAAVLEHMEVLGPKGGLSQAVLHLSWCSEIPLENRFCHTDTPRRLQWMRWDSFSHHAAPQGAWQLLSQ